MRTVKRSAHVPYSPSQMFDLVNDVARYPEFLPWCEWSRVDSAEGDIVDASVGVALGGFRQSFRTRNRLDRPQSIKISLLEGPFRALEGGWSFERSPEGGSEVTLALDFEVKPSPLKLAFELVFEEVTRRQVAAFARRAEQLYG